MSAPAAVPSSTTLAAAATAVMAPCPCEASFSSVSMLNSVVVTAPSANSMEVTTFDASLPHVTA